MKKILSATAVSLVGCTTLLAGSKPNVVILLSDDLGYKDIGCYDGPVQTPNMDFLAAQGTKFTDFYSGCAVCSPSRATLLTGRHHIRAGVYSWIENNRQASHLLEREVTIAEVLKDSGYATAHFGKWHLGLPGGKRGDKPTPSEHGFDYWFATDNNAMPTHHNPVNFIRNGKAVGELKGYSCQLVVDEAINWLDNRETTDEPFFLNVWFHEPHTKLAAPPELCEKYKDATAPAAVEAQPVKEGKKGKKKKKGPKPGKEVYSATIDNTDLAIGRLLAKLKEVAPAEDTLIIYSSDNGSREKGRCGDLRGIKGTNWDGGIRVPGIFYWPGKVSSGKVVNEPAGLVDLLPTLCSLLGKEKPAGIHLDGADITPLLVQNGSSFDRHQPLFWHLQKARPIVAMRDGNYSLVAEPDYEVSTSNMFEEKWIPAIKQGGYKNYQLFDLAKDPNQTTNIADAHPELLDRLKKKLLEINSSIMADGTDWHLKK